MKKLPSWANCWIVDGQGNRMPADSYIKKGVPRYYDEHGKEIIADGISEVADNGGIWIVALFFLTIVVWIGAELIQWSSIPVR